MLFYVYPNHETNEIQYSNPQNESSIIHNNVATYAQALKQFHELNPVPETSSHQRLNFNSTINPFPLKETPSKISLNLFTIRVK